MSNNIIVKLSLYQEFNPNLIGYALGDSLAYHEESQLNVAETGAMSQDMPYMAEVLVKRIKSDPRIDVEKHWKVCYRRQIQFFTGMRNRSMK